MKIYVVNLLKAKSRRERIMQHLSNCSIKDYQLIEAVDGSTLTSFDIDAHCNDVKTRKLYGKSLLPGEIGCALSHISIYKNLLDHNHPFALILEDDAFLSEKAIDLINDQNILTMLRQQTPIAILCSSLDYYYDSPIKKISKQHNLVGIHYVSRTHGYLINKEAAKRILELNNRVIYKADDWHHFRSTLGIKLYGVDPAIIYLHASYANSSIGGVRKNPFINEYFLNSIKRTTVRLINKLLIKPTYRIFRRLSSHSLIIKN